ncbi:MAG TPA: ROK family protein [Steroidobacteraceae bacterium]|nr:ROK family protein [Steroidobacteraceae bacterium]
MRIGIDLGGTKTEIIVLDDQGAVLFRRREATPATDYGAILERIAGLVSCAENSVGPAHSVGIATPGVISLRTGLMKNSNTIVLNGKPLDRDLANRLDRPVRLQNDANCFALSESIDGAAATAKVVFGVILGTGVGGSIVVDKQLLVGHNAVAGEWGHNPLPWAREEDPPETCYCGKVGCIETYLSGAGLSRDFRHRTGRECTALEISGAAALGDDAARGSIELYQDRLARSLASVVNLIDPEAIVLGGGLSNIAQLYDELPQLIADYAFSDGLDTVVLRALYGDSSGVRGAARLWG